MNILNSKDPNMDPCGTPNKISLQEVYESLTFTLCLHYACCLAINSS